jgi:putative SOS response-associated peptidase YedK
MCGRFGLFSELDDLAEQFNFAPTIVRDIYQPRFRFQPGNVISAASWRTIRL